MSKLEWLTIIGNIAVNENLEKLAEDILINQKEINSRLSINNPFLKKHYDKIVENNLTN